MSVTELAAEYVAKRDEMEVAKKRVTDLTKELELCEMELYREMVKSDLTSAKFDSLGVRLTAKMSRYPRIKPEAKTREQEIFEWLREAGHGDVIREQVHPQTMKSTLRDIIHGLESSEIPDFVEIYEEPGVAMTRVQ